MKNSKCDLFRSQKRDGELKVIASIVTILFFSFYLIQILIDSFSYGYLDLIFLSTLMLFFILWLIYNMIREHFIYKSNFTSDPNKIIFKSLIYNKELMWSDVESIVIDVLMPVPSILPYNATRCIVLKLKNNKQHLILHGGYKNIEEFKDYLKEHFQDKIVTSQSEQ